MAKPKFKIRKNDQVMIVTGEDKGKTGRVLNVDVKKNRVLVEGINIVKKAVKPRSEQEKGGIIEVEAPVHISNVMLIGKDGSPVRVGIRKEGDSSVRYSKKNGEVL